MNRFKKLWYGRSIPLRLFLFPLIFLFAWQLYAVRELIVLEAVFTLIVLLIVALGFFLYFLGAAVELVVVTTIAEAHMIGRAVHHSVHGVEELAGRFWHSGVGIRANK